MGNSILGELMFIVQLNNNYSTDAGLFAMRKRNRARLYTKLEDYAWVYPDTLAFTTFKLEFL